MPGRNTVKEYSEGCYYHLYNRGVNKGSIFLDCQDYTVFLSLIKRHLSATPRYDKLMREYVHLTPKVSLLSYCLMPNHFHLFVYNKERDGIEKLMRSVCTAYTMYFNRRYQRVGSLYQGIYRGVLIDSNTYLQHVSRYIHRNPSNYKDYDYSSYKALVKNWKIEWLDTAAFWDTFDGTVSEYVDFVADYEDYKESLQDTSTELADH